MPVITGGPSLPYDTVSDVLNTAAMRLHDHIPSIYPTGGSLLGESSIFTQVAFNAGWRKLQNLLSNWGYAAFTKEVIIYGVPATQQVQDPASEVALGWTGYYDGLAYYPNYALPQDLVFPLIVWERWSQQGTGSFTQMTNWVEGFPTLPKQPRMMFWEWRTQALCMPGSLMAEDIRIRYARMMPDFLDNPAGPSRWYQQQVPLMNCRDALAYLVCSEMVTTDEDLDFDATIFSKAGEDAARLIMNRDVRKNQRVNLRRQARSGRNRMIGWNFW